MVFKIFTSRLKLQYSDFVILMKLTSWLLWYLFIRSQLSNSAKEVYFPENFCLFWTNYVFLSTRIHYICIQCTHNILTEFKRAFIRDNSTNIIRIIYSLKMKIYLDNGRGVIIAVVCGKSGRWNLWPKSETKCCLHDANLYNTKKKIRM